MMAIQFDHVSKQFTLHHERPRSLQELFLNAFHLKHTPSKEKHLVLDDVSFEVKRGEMVGIVGPNGAGKSTILKLMSRIIEPTSGQIEVHGRIGALLELGSGFHPDLTGRENVYLNGSILGLSKSTMDRIFPDIVDFSELEHFIDIPVKHYSSGMFMRLGFSVAIHLQPDILLVDEVLAVGDQAFQLRCLDRINEMRRRGITTILVSHELRKVREMCDRAIWLDKGHIQAQGPVDSVLEQYTTRVFADDERALEKAESAYRAEDALREDGSSWRWGSREAEIVAVEILSAKGQGQRTFQTGDPLTVRMHYTTRQPIQNPRFGLALYHSSGFHINGPNNVFANYRIPEIDGPGFVDYTVESLPLLPGTYMVTAAIYDYEGKHAYDHIHQHYTFRVRAGGVREEFGSFYFPATWAWNPGGSMSPSTESAR